jgi:hypothetical protein
MRRRALFALLGARLVARPAAVAAQQRPKVHVILWVSTQAQPDPSYSRDIPACLRPLK